MLFDRILEKMLLLHHLCVNIKPRFGARIGVELKSVQVKV
jgi:hypothetical protein